MEETTEEGNDCICCGLFVFEHELFLIKIYYPGLRSAIVFSSCCAYVTGGEPK